ncbi:hypothetical protein GW17_00050041, partial [Ensete ventricosum]
ATLQAGVPAGVFRPYGLVAAGHAHKRRPCELLPPQVAPTYLAGCCPREWHRPTLRVVAPASDVSLPCEMALAAAWPWVAGPVWGLVVAGRPSSSLPSLQKCSKNT